MAGRLIARSVRAKAALDTPLEGQDPAGPVAPSGQLRCRSKHRIVLRFVLSASCRRPGPHTKLSSTLSVLSSARSEAGRERNLTRKTLTAAFFVLLTLVIASAAQGGAAGKGKPVPPTPVPTTPSITGAVYTTVNLNDPNYPNECNNGNPAVNCNQYTAKQYVYLNGGPTKNELSPDGVYFFAVLAPGTQKDPADGVNSADGAPGNLSSPYDCYLNREIIIKGGEVSGVLTSTDPSCFKNTGILPVGTGHKLAGPQGPFVQLWPYIDTPNPGGVYIMAVCYVASPATTPTAPVPLANPSSVDPSTCKYDAFKVQADTTPPMCKLVSTSPGPPKSITVVVQDAGAGLEKVVYSGFNILNPPTFPNPLVVGMIDPYYVIATKDDQTQGASLALTITDVAGNTTSCDPTFGIPQHRRSATVAAGHKLAITGLASDQARLSLRNPSRLVRAATIAVNGHRFATVALGHSLTAHLNLRAALVPHRRNVVTVTAAGTAGKLLVGISN
jgi:hypothetical protein